MFKFAVALIVTTGLVNVYAVVRKLKRYQVRRSGQADEYLDAPERAEALPVVLILEENGTLSVPTNIKSLSTENRKVVNGTQFKMLETGSSTQIFFCPQQEENSQNTCLAPRDFRDSEQLRCELEPTFRVGNEFDNIVMQCGEGGFLHIVYFPICSSNLYVTKGLTTYQFCYKEQKIVFTSHFISSPKLLDTFLLYQDRKINYPYVYDDNYPIANYQDLYTHEESSLVSSKITNYQVQNFVPSEDMPFGIWKKLINQSYNVGLIHNNVHELWSYINFQVRVKAIKKHYEQFLVKTGVYEHGLQDIPIYGVQIYNFWVKVIVSMERQSNVPLSGVALFMNNFLCGHGDLRISEELLLYQKFVTFCEEVVNCHSYLISMSGVSSIWLQCCRVTLKLALYFNVPVENTLPLIDIPELITP